MKKSITSCVFVAPVATMASLPFERTAVMFAEGFGYFAQSLIVRSLMSKEERVGYDADMALLASLPPDFQEQECVPCFASLEETLEYVSAHEAMQSLWQDMRAFGAPNECATTPCSRIDKRITAAEGKVVCHLHSDDCPMIEAEQLLAEHFN